MTVKTCVVSTLSLASHSMQASQRIARFIQDELNIPLIDSSESCTRFQKSLKGRRCNMIFVNGALAFLKYRDELGSLFQQVEDVIWVQNDYTILVPPHHSSGRPSTAETSFRKNFYNIPKLRVWTTCQDTLDKRRYKSDRYINWNALTYSPLDGSKEPTRNRVFYYGALRENREQPIKRLLFRKSEKPWVTISMSNDHRPARDKWNSLLGDNINFVSPVRPTNEIHQSLNGNGLTNTDLTRSIGRYRHSLYVGDAKSNTRFHSLANRFYEVLSTPGTVLWLDAEGAMTYDKAGLVGWERFAVSSAEELKAKLSIEPDKLLKYARYQRKKWLSDDPYIELQSRLQKISGAIL